MPTGITGLDPVEPVGSFGCQNMATTLENASNILPMQSNQRMTHQLIQTKQLNKTNQQQQQQTMTMRMHSCHHYELWPMLSNVVLLSTRLWPWQPDDCQFLPLDKPTELPDCNTTNKTLMKWQEHNAADQESNQDLAISSQDLTQEPASNVTLTHNPNNSENNVENVENGATLE